MHSVKTEKLCIIDILTNDSKVKKTRSIKSSIILEILAFTCSWIVSGMCTPVSAAAAAAKSLAKEKYWKGRGVWNIKRKQQLFIFLCGGVQLQVFFS